MDIKVRVRYKAMASYILEYITKNEPASDALNQVLKMLTKARRGLSADDPGVKALRRLLIGVRSSLEREPLGMLS
ncbi:hypothetical protein Pmar_PMAR009241 [Perkinsus marinus ATCC 50983]|uniref:Uncharacterized protein n=1 Tax=Perkinsus marinus (strain ATCC 50983 / TXsc) TaxID=423536 RepID=C5M0D7_PERM5|nr:hypothetical protein Pmar_PMAR009241 [Perkinsus marinus ATCC 50983]EEQ97544.1 hypothetical protein Pmar_PMAR009241 [Perkinsus marinus ATCC 50983]|eukprot:XP_002764827.1 hypothetical protein Pmar_PMAR009241 [Perkinsus marinus ATCC 50983]